MSSPLVVIFGNMERSLVLQGVHTSKNQQLKKKKSPPPKKKKGVLTNSTYSRDQPGRAACHTVAAGSPYTKNKTVTHPWPD